MRTIQRALARGTTYRAEITNIGGAGLATFTWDFEDRLASIEYSDGLMAWGEEFTYNGLGTRISKYDSTGYREYMRNGAGVTSPVLSDEDAVYTPGISERRSSATRYYHADLKNGVAQVNASQAIAATKQYDAFGNETSSSGTWNGPFGYGGPFGYQSDPDSGLKLLGHRYYDSSTGRFLTRDRAKDGRNWYVYCESNPLSRADADGLRIQHLTGDQRVEVHAAIELIDDYGWGHYAGQLRALAAAGEIRVNTRFDSSTHGGVNVNLPWGFKGIQRNPDLVERPTSARRYTMPGGATRLEADRLWLASVLVHELFHYRVGRFFWWQANRNEHAAWKLQYIFLDWAAFWSMSPELQKELEPSVDRARANVSELGPLTW